MQRTYSPSPFPKLFHSIFCAYVALQFLSSSRLPAQVTTIGDDNSNEPLTYKMTVSPASEPTPALKYHLLVPPVDQINDNAATFYYKSMVFEEPDWVYQLSREPLEGEIDTWLEMALEKLPQDEIKKKVVFVLPGTQWQPLIEASRCNHCEWGDQIREEGAFTLLPQAQKMRNLARGLALKSRLEIANRKYSDGLDTLRLGYALSRNLGHGCCLVQSLIGLAIESYLNTQTRTLMAAENSPNLYWALSDLVARPVDLRNAMSNETQIWEFTVHPLADLTSRTLTEKEARDLADKVWEMQRYMRSGNRPSKLEPASMLLWCVRLWPEAREYLLQHGYQPADLKGMPVLQVVLLYRWKQYLLLRDDYFKWSTLPDDEFNRPLIAAQDRIDDLIKQGEGQPFSAALPVIRPSIRAQLRQHRQMNLLRVVEALRMYAADHGRWPDNLTEIKNVLVPNDPFTNRLFEYTLKDGIAILSSAHDQTWSYPDGAAL